MSWPGETRNVVGFVRIKNKEPQFVRSSAPPLLMGYSLTYVERKKGMHLIHKSIKVISFLIILTVRINPFLIIDLF